MRIWLQNYKRCEWTQSSPLDARIRGTALRVLRPGPRLLLAVVQHRLGQTDAARNTFDLAIAGYDWNPAKATDRESWIYHLLRREAEATILSEPKPAAANDQSVISNAL